MRRDYYKQFKGGDYVVCIKEDSCTFSNLLDPKTEGINLQLFKTYIVDKYLVRQDGSEIYHALILKGYTPLHNGRNFVLLSEFRKMKLNKLKRKLFIKKVLEKLIFKNNLHNFVLNKNK